MRDTFVMQSIPEIDPGCEESVERAFSRARSFPMRQPWLASADARLRPGSVRIGFNSGVIWVFAELFDDDIFNQIEGFNEVAFKGGDVFEMFFAPEGQQPYYEFHVTPGNSRLQLRFPRPGAARELPAGDDPLGVFKVAGELFKSWATVADAGGRWSVLARVPLRSIAEGASPAAVRCSFCRYDYSRDNPEPVLSSTSQHAMCDFHRMEEWTRFLLPA